MMDFPINKYPTLAPTDPNVLFESLGSFWTMVFEEKATIKGYTLAQAEELIQHYYNLTEVINSYAVSKAPLHHQEKWYPIIVKRSQFNTSPLTFQPGEAVFGPQPADDPYYADLIFKFGFPKSPNARVYTYKADKQLHSVPIIANQIINPSLVLINNVDYRLENNVLYFNKDIFSLPDVPKTDVIGENGIPVTYKDLQGVVQQEQIAILWGYHAKEDKEVIFNSHGYVFDIKQPSTEEYRSIIKSIFNLFVDGPTVKAIKAISAAFVGIKPILSAEEIIQEQYVDGDYRFIVTDKNVYKYDKYYVLRPELHIGSVVLAGDVIVDAVDYYDHVQVRNWWSKKIVPKVSLMSGETNSKTKQMAFPPHMFVGNPKHAFIFENELQLVTCNTAGNITFPIQGDPADVKAFHEALNANKEALQEALGVNPGGAVSINPLDFIFDNFLKHNSALIKVNFKNLEQATAFINFFEVTRECLPAHVYFIFYFDFLLDHEVVDNLNGQSEFEVYTEASPEALVTRTGWNADGTNADGKLVGEPNDDNSALIVTRLPLARRLFSISKSFFQSILLEEVIGNATSAGQAGVRDGGLQAAPAPGTNSRDIGHLMFMTFSELE